jgi:hypothetical protein
MRHFATLAIAVMLLGAVLLCQAQYVDRAEMNPYTGLVTSSDFQLQQTPALLNPGQFQIHHSMQIGMGQFGDSGSSTGLFLSEMSLLLRPNLGLKVCVGVRGTQFHGATNAELRQDFVGSAEMTWRPSKNLSLRFSAARGLNDAHNPWSNSLLHPGFNSYLQH